MLVPRCGNCGVLVSIATGLPVSVSFAQEEGRPAVATVQTDILEIDDDYQYGSCCEDGPVLTDAERETVHVLLGRISEVGRRVDPGLIVLLADAADLR